jgi:hypothetical protein
MPNTIVCNERALIRPKPRAYCDCGGLIGDPLHDDYCLGYQYSKTKPEHTIIATIIAIFTILILIFTLLLINEGWTKSALGGARAVGFYHPLVTLRKLAEAMVARPSNCNEFEQIQSNENLLSSFGLVAFIDMHTPGKVAIHILHKRFLFWKKRKEIKTFIEEHKVLGIEVVGYAHFNWIKIKVL